MTENQFTTAHDHDDHPMTPDLAATVAEWDAAAALARADYTERAALMLAGIIPDAEPRPCYVCARPSVHTIGGRRYCRDCAPMPTPPAPRVHVTAQMIADIWQDGRRDEVARILAGLPREERGRVETEYLKLLRARGHRITLRVIKRQFQLVIAMPHESRLAA